MINALKNYNGYYIVKDIETFKSQISPNKLNKYMGDNKVNM